MKKTLLLLSSLILFAVPSARSEISLEVFYDSLEPHGEWVEIDGYGYCWTPGQVEADWRPYTDGSWVYTDAGWTWVSDEPYGWAVYHYGRWLRTENVGWVWVPGEEWGPAWVSWRRSPEYVGWAPLPPEVRFSRSVGISSRIDVEFDIGPSYYSFVPVRSFGSERLRTVIVEPRRNVTIINQTRNITNITYVNKTVINRGPDFEVMSRESERPIRRLKLNRRTDFAADERRIEGGARIAGDSLEVSAPQIVKSAKAKPKAARKIEQAKVDRGWKGAGSEAEVEKVRAQMKQEESEPEATSEAPEVEAAAEDKPAKTETKEPRARKSQEAATEEPTPTRKAAKRPKATPEAVEEKESEPTKKPEKAKKEHKAESPASDSEVTEKPTRQPKKKAAVETAPVEAAVAPPQREKKVRQQMEPAREVPARVERKSEQPQIEEPKVRKPKQEKAPRVPKAAPAEAAPEAPATPEEILEKKRGKDKKGSEKSTGQI